MRNYEEIFESIVTQTGDYLKRYNLKSMALGLSGGLDSTVCAAIGKEVSKRYGVKMLGISLPCSTNSETENTIAKNCGKAFCDRFITMNLQDLYMLTRAKCDNDQGESTPLSQGNLKARLRMIMIYNLASINGGIVLDTDNLSENMLGFWTIHGDVGDYKPIGKLWKSEVYELASYILERYRATSEDKAAIDAMEGAIAIVPTDGNGVSALGDMDQIAPGYTYKEVDKVLQNILEPKCEMSEIADTYFNGDMNTVNGIINRYKRSEFKRDNDYIGAVL